jgi:hypothetical protein
VTREERDAMGLIRRIFGLEQDPADVDQDYDYYPQRQEPYYPPVQQTWDQSTQSEGANKWFHDYRKYTGA